MELRRSKRDDVHLDAVDRVHLAVGRRGRGLLLELALLVAGHFLSLQQRCADRSAVSVAALLPMREHRAGPVSRAAVALASDFSVLGDCLRVDQKTRRPTARPHPSFGHTSGVACAETQFLLRGTIAPLVLDSPFGTLDSAYRNAVAQFLPDMTEQIILLVSESQGPDELLDNFREKIGAEYILVLHQPEPPETSEEREKPRLTPRMLYNKEYVRLITSSEQRGTEIMEVRSNG